MPLYTIRDICPWNSDYSPKPYLYLYLLLRLSATQVSRHEDIFYALRPLATKELLLPEPVYGETNVELHKKHAAAFVRMGWAAAILQYAGIAWRQTQELPSWCPEFGPEIARVTINESISQWTLRSPGYASQALLTSSPAKSKYFEVREPDLTSSLPKPPSSALLNICVETNTPAIYSVSDTMRFYRWVFSVRSRIKTQVTRSLSSFICDQLVELSDDDWRLHADSQQRFHLPHFDLALRTLLAPLYPRVFEDEFFRSGWIRNVSRSYPSSRS